MAAALSTLRPFTIAVIVATVLLACAHGGTQSAWHEVRDGSVVARSCGRQADTLDLVADLREIRATLSQLIPSIPMRDVIPFRLHIFCRDSDLRFASPRPVQGNHFVQTIRDVNFDATYESQRVATITLASGTHILARSSSLRVTGDLIRHHYAHHLLRAYSNVPVWIDEGLATFVATTKRKSDLVVRGRMPFGFRSYRGAGLGVPLGRILRATDLSEWPYRERVEFYRGAWTFIHFLRFESAAADETARPEASAFRRAARGQHRRGQRCGAGLRLSAPPPTSRRGPLCPHSVGEDRPRSDDAPHRLDAGGGSRGSFGLGGRRGR